MKDKNLIIKQGRQYFAQGGLDGVYKKLYAYEQIADKPEKVIAIDKVLEIIDTQIEALADGKYGGASALNYVYEAVMALKGGEDGTGN